jgi:serine/threonine-protein kinase
MLGGMAPPERIGRYEIVAPLSRGGMGDVYLARVEGLGSFQRHVVLKTLEVGESDDDAIAMFLDEARVLGVLHHQHIAPVYEIDREDGRMYLVMDYVHGHNAHTVWQRTLEIGAALPIDFSLTVASAAASGLHYAHTRRGTDGALLRIVHRDVSLSNLMIGFDGAVKLIDFGIATATNRLAKTQAGFVKGKVAYMAPEQLRGQVLDGRTDVFALGIVLYELTTMRRPFREESDRATVERIKNGTFALPSTIVDEYPAELERVVVRALKVDPRERYPDADTLRRELEALGHRLELVLGDTAVAEVMTQLFEDRREPWQRRPTSRADTEIDTSVEIESRDDTKPSHSPNRRAGTLRTATDTIDALIEKLDTPVRGTPIAEPPASGRQAATAIPVATASTDTDAITTIGVAPERPSARPSSAPPIPRTPFPRMPSAPPPVPLPPSPPPPSQLPPSAAVPVMPVRPIAPPGARSRKPVYRPVSPRVGWTAASVVGAAAIAVAVISLLEDDPALVTVAEPVTIDAAAPPPVTIDAMAAVVVDAPVDAPTSVKLVVITTPPDATVTLAGARLGKTPFEGIVGARSGPQTLSIRRRGYVPVRLEVSLEADVTQTIKLQRAPGP